MLLDGSLEGRLSLDRLLGCRLSRLLDLRVIAATTGTRRATTILVGATVLFHVVFAGEGLVALGTEGILLTSVLLCVTGSVTRGGEVVGTVELLGQRARVLVLLGRDGSRVVAVGRGRHGRYA